MSQTLEDAIALAVAAHRGQRDKADRPYILHPLRLMLAVGRDDLAAMAAVLHDVVEDCDETLDSLRRRGYPEAVVRAVDHLTRRDDETYAAFIERAATDPIARRVKLADLEDNMDIRRLGEVDERSAERLARYLRAWQRLSDPA